MLNGLYIKTAKFGKGGAGGSITHTLGMINGFADAGVNLTVLTTEEIDPCKGNVIVLPVHYNKKLPPFFRDYVYYNQFYRKIREWYSDNDIRFDFIYSRHMAFCTVAKKIAQQNGLYLITEVNNTQCDSVWSLVIAPKMEARRKLIRPFYYVAGKTVSLIIRLLENPVFKASDQIVVISEPIKEKMIKRGLTPKGNIQVLPNGVDPDRFKPDEKAGDKVRQVLSIDKNKVIVGFAGTFGNWHGIPELTDAIHQIVKNDNLSFILLGDGLMKPYMEERLKEFENVHFLGLVPYSKMPAYLSACDILIVSNSWDPKFKEPFFGSPTKLFEYMSMGKTIVASRLEQINELLKDNESALMFDPGDSNGMARAILRGSRDPQLRKKLGGNAQILAIEKHTWKANADKIIEAIRNR